MRGCRSRRPRGTTRGTGPGGSATRPPPVPHVLHARARHAARRGKRAQHECRLRARAALARSFSRSSAIASGIMVPSAIAAITPARATSSRAVRSECARGPARPRARPDRRSSSAAPGPPCVPADDRKKLYPRRRASRKRCSSVARRVEQRVWARSAPRGLHLTVEALDRRDRARESSAASRESSVPPTASLDERERRARSQRPERVKRAPGGCRRARAAIARGTMTTPVPSSVAPRARPRAGAHASSAARLPARTRRARRSRAACARRRRACARGTRCGAFVAAQARATAARPTLQRDHE